MKQSAKKAAPRGRPRVDSEALTLRLRRPVLSALDRFIDQDGRGWSRPEAIRQLLEDALTTVGALPPGSGASGVRPYRRNTHSRVSDKH